MYKKRFYTNTPYIYLTLFWLLPLALSIYLLFYGNNIFVAGALFVILFFIFFDSLLSASECITVFENKIVIAKKLRPKLKFPFSSYNFSFNGKQTVFDKRGTKKHIEYQLVVSPKAQSAFNKSLTAITYNWQCSETQYEKIKEAVWGFIK